MPTLKNVVFALFPKSVYSFEFIPEFSNSVKGLFEGGYENIFNLPPDAPLEIPRLLINGDKFSASLSSKRIDLSQNIDNISNLTEETEEINKIKKFFELVSKEESIKLGQIGIVFRYLLEQDKVEDLWEQILVKEKINLFAEIQKQKSITVVTDAEKDNVKYTKQILISEYKKDPYQEELETLLQIDINNIFKKIDFENIEEFARFLQIALNENNACISNLDNLENDSEQ